MGSLCLCDVFCACACVPTVRVSLVIQVIHSSLPTVSARTPARLLCYHFACLVWFFDYLRQCFYL